MITASSGARSHRNVTTQSPHADVPSITHSSQLIRMQGTLRRGCDRQIGQGLDRARRPAPPALHRVNTLRDHRWLLDRELPAHGVVVKGADGGRDRHIEAREVPTGAASVPRCVTHGGRRYPHAQGPGAPPEAPGPRPPISSPRVGDGQVRRLRRRLPWWPRWPWPRGSSCRTPRRCRPSPRTGSHPSHRTSSAASPRCGRAGRASCSSGRSC